MLSISVISICTLAGEFVPHCGDLQQVRKTLAREVSERICLTGRKFIVKAAACPLHRDPRMEEADSCGSRIRIPQNVP